MKTKRSSGERRHRRNRLHFVQHGACFWCGSPVARESATLDEVIPRSRGGSDRWGNTVMSCKPRNKRKGCDAPPTWALAQAEHLRRIAHSPAVRQIFSANMIEASA